MENENKVDVKGGSIDTDVLQIMKEEDVLKAISDDTQIKRVILNCACEMYGEIKNLNKAFDEFSRIISICSADKLTGFFKEVQKNAGEETTRLKVQEKIEKSHKKPQKRQKVVKKEEKIAKKLKNSVK